MFFIYFILPFPSFWILHILFKLRKRVCWSIFGRCAVRRMLKKSTWSDEPSWAPFSGLKSTALSKIRERVEVFLSLWNVCTFLINSWSVVIWHSFLVIRCFSYNHSTIYFLHERIYYLAICWDATPWNGKLSFANKTSPKLQMLKIRIALILI